MHVRSGRCILYNTMAPPSFLTRILTTIHTSYGEEHRTWTDVNQQEDVPIPDVPETRYETHDSTAYGLESVQDENEDEEETMGDYQDETLDKDEEDDHAYSMDTGTNLMKKMVRRTSRNQRRILDEHFQRTHVCVRLDVSKNNDVHVRLDVRTRNVRPRKRVINVEKEKRIQTIHQMRTYVREQFERLSMEKETAIYHEARLWERYPIDPTHPLYYARKDQYKHAFLKERKRMSKDV